MGKNAEIALPGVGEFYAKYGTHATAGAPFMLGRLRDANISMGASTSELRAGSGLLPLDVATVEKSLTISATNGLANMQNVYLTQGKVDTETSEMIPRFVPRALFTVPAATTFEIDFPTGYLESENVIIEYADGSGRLTKGTTPTAAGIFQEDTVNSVWIFHANDASARLAISYVYEYDIDTSGATDGVTATVLDTRQKACPFLLHYTHSFTECSNTRGLELLVYKVRPSGEFSLPMEQGGHATPNFEVSAVDPLRADYRIGILLIERLES